MKNTHLLRACLTVVCLLALIFCFSCACAEVESYIVKSGSCGSTGNNVRWMLYSDGQMAIVGNGAMADYASCRAPWYTDYHSMISSVVIKSGVTHIGNSAFESCKNITSVKISDSVTSIGKRAFVFCDHMTALEMPDNVKTIGSEAFRGCRVLENFVMPEKLTEIGDYAFSLCEKLTEIRIPEGVTTLSKGVFSFCSGVRNLILPATLKKLDVYAFRGCGNLKGVTVLNDALSFASSAFYECSKQLLFTCGCTSTARAFAQNEGFENVALRHDFAGGSTCIKCGYNPDHGQTPDAPDAPETPETPPQTGDSAHPVLWSVMLALSLAGILILARFGKRAK